MATRQLNEVERLIQYLSLVAADGSLCGEGVERLRWWMGPGRKFTTIKAGMAAWTPEQVQAFFEHFGMAKKSIEELKSDIRCHAGWAKDSRKRETEHRKQAEIYEGRVLAFKAELTKIAKGGSVYDDAAFSEALNEVDRYSKNALKVTRRWS